MLRDVKEGNNRSTNTCKRGARKQPHSYSIGNKFNVSEGSYLAHLRNLTQRGSDKNTLAIHLHHQERRDRMSRKPKSEVLYKQFNRLLKRYTPQALLFISSFLPSPISLLCAIRTVNANNHSSSMY